MAGIVTPTVLSFAVYLVAVAGYPLFSLPPVPNASVFNVIIFPLVVITNLWGIWNGLYAVLPRKLPLAVHGALLPILNFGLGYAVMRISEFPATGDMMRMVPISLLMSMVFYYLLWKFVVAFLNTLVDVD
jgi:hypothetical protein